MRVQRVQQEQQTLVLVAQQTQVQQEQQTLVHQSPQSEPLGH